MKFDNVVAKFLEKKKSRREDREWRTNEREKVNSTLSMSQLLPIFSLLVTKNGGERKSKSGNGVVEIRGEREKVVCNCGKSFAKIGERKKVLLVAMVLPQLPTLFSIPLISR